MNQLTRFTLLPLPLGLTALLVSACVSFPMAASADIDTSSLRPQARAARDTNVSKSADADLGAANAGDASAQFRVANRFDTGQGVPKDYARAAKWYRRAAEQGHAEAQVNLALMYSEGQGVERDPRAAVQWFEKASRAGNVRAHYSLGLMHYHGQGVPQNHREAFRLYELAAIGGHANAMNNLGILYGLGEGVSQNDLNAYAWFALAAQYGDENAAKNRDLTSKELDETRLAQAQKLLGDLKRKIR